MLKGMLVTTMVNIPMVDAFDLKIYALQRQDTFDTVQAYNNSFEIIPYNDLYRDPTLQNIVDDESGYIYDVKSVQHSFLNHAPNKICMIKNKYPVITKIIPQYKLTVLQQDEVKTNIIKALFNALNSRKVEFGEEIAYDFVYDTIQQADERIKSVVLDYINYTSYAVYLDPEEGQHGTYKEVAISDNYMDAYVTGVYTDAQPSYTIRYVPGVGLLVTDNNVFYVDNETGTITHFIAQDGDIVDDEYGHHFIWNQSSEEWMGYVSPYPVVPKCVAFKTPGVVEDGTYVDVYYFDQASNTLKKVDATNGLVINTETEMSLDDSEFTAQYTSAGKYEFKFDGLQWSISVSGSPSSFVPKIAGASFSPEGLVVRGDTVIVQVDSSHQVILKQFIPGHKSNYRLEGKVWREYDYSNSSENGKGFAPDNENIVVGTQSQYLDTHTHIVYTYNRLTQKVELYSDKIDEFRLDLYTKSVLNGNTQLLIPDTAYDYQLNQTDGQTVPDIVSVTTNAEDVIGVNPTENTDPESVVPSIDQGGQVIVLTLEPT
jgi:hypothetical protein